MLNLRSLGCQKPIDQKVGNAPAGREKRLLRYQRMIAIFTYVGITKIGNPPFKYITVSSFSI
jgi:hypothetical protein